MSTTRKPNIIFILTDQQSASMMSCAGNKYLKTPAMDSLAASGMRFEKAYCTNPVCLPSRFSLMTGRMPSEVGIRSNVIDDMDPIPNRVRKESLGTLMKNAGYETAYGGKIHLPDDLLPAKNDFDYITNDERDLLADTCAEFIKKPHDKPFFLYTSFINPHDICYMAIRAFAHSDHSKDLVARGKIEIAELDEALRIPEGVSEKEFFEKHCPPLPPNHQPQEDEPEALKMIREQRNFKQLAFENWSEKEWRLHRWAYCRLTERVDAQIGRVLDAVKESGQWENTVIIFSSDHGDLDSTRRMEHKTALYEEATKVPLIVSWPGVTRGGTVNDTHLISNGLDLLPTLCDYAGVDVPEDLAGMSFKGLSEGENPKKWREHLYIESEFGLATCVTDHKYALYDDGDHREQLYDLANDHHETQNHAHHEHKQETLSTLRSALDFHKKRHNEYRSRLLASQCP